MQWLGTESYIISSLMSFWSTTVATGVSRVLLLFCEYFAHPESATELMFWTKKGNISYCASDPHAGSGQRLSMKFLFVSDAWSIPGFCKERGRYLSCYSSYPDHSRWRESYYRVPGSCMFRSIPRHLFGGSKGTCGCRHASATNGTVSPESRYHPSFKEPCFWLRFTG